MNTATATPSKQIEVQIMGQSYLLACPPGGESALIEAVERVDTTMCRIRDAGKVKARERIAVLTSLNMAFELSQMDADRLRNKAACPSDTATHARMQALMERLDDALNGDDQLR